MSGELGQPMRCNFCTEPAPALWTREHVHLEDTTEQACPIEPRGTLMPPARVHHSWLFLLICATAVNLTVLDASPLASLTFAAVALVIVLLRRHELLARGSRRPLAATSGTAEHGEVGELRHDVEPVPSSELSAWGRRYDAP
jgi:hypothetical protein